MIKLTRDDCMAAIEKGDFGSGIVKAAPAVAVVLTQSWCPQWGWMRRYLESLPARPGFEVFWLEYDREDFFERFMTFKEEVYGNREVPYVRYYRDGQLLKESNFIDQRGFLRLAGLD
ncbi:MAG TPA: hypothetical protein VMV90_05225 [Rectinemataceae bacterium]|nr:hypothetical protein [Rectinemataceae bacterium]